MTSPVKPRITVAYPCYGGVQAPHIVSFFGIAAHLYANDIGNGIISMSSSLLDWARNQIVEQALTATCPPTHLLWLDADIVLPEDTPSRLLAHDTDIVSGLYVRRTDPYDTMVFDISPEFKIGTPVDESTPLQPIGGAGLGCLLVRFSVFQRMAEYFGDHTWFRATWPEYGEDVWFFRRCHEMGIQPYLDTTLRLGHLTLSQANYQSPSPNGKSATISPNSPALQKAVK